MKTHRLGGGCRQCPADVSREWIGQCCTNHHQHQPTLPSKPPDSAPIRTQGSHPSKPTHTPPPRPPNSSPTREIRSKRGTPHTPRRPRSLGGDDLDTPTLPNRTHLTIRSLFSREAATEQPGLAAPPLWTRHSLTLPPAETVHQHCRLEPSSLENLPRRTTRHWRTGPQATCHEGQEVAGGGLADSPL